MEHFVEKIIVVAVIMLFVVGFVNVMDLGMAHTTAGMTYGYNSDIARSIYYEGSVASANYLKMFMFAMFGGIALIVVMN